MYSSVESIVGSVEAGRPRGRGGAARAEQWRPRSVALCIVVAGAGLVEAGPCIGRVTDIVRPRYCAANGRGARPEPRTAPHRRTPPAALSPVTGGCLLPTLHYTLPSHPGLYRPYSPSCGDQADLNPAAEPLSGQGAVQRGGGARPGPASVLLSQRRRGAGTESSTVATLLQWLQ